MKINKFNIEQIPSKCGVYLFKNDDDILYVGKAKNIKKRILQYLNGSTNSFKTPLLLENANNIDFIICSNEKESLLLEQELIKKYRPHFNILLIDDKKYPYISIELKPNGLEIKSKFYYRNKKNSYYFGPLPYNYGYKSIINFLIRETLFENGLPIVRNNDIEFWKNKFEYAKKILSSSNNEIIKKLKIKMEEAAENEQYELAKDFRDVINHLSNKEENQSITFKELKPFDVIFFKQKENMLLISLHHFIGGSFFMNEEFIFEIKIDLYHSITSFINELYLVRNIPNEIITNVEIDPIDLRDEIKIIVPQKGKYKQALENAKSNIEVNEETKILSFVNKQKQVLNVKKYIEDLIKTKVNDFIMIDNSNEGNVDIVSVIIYYRNFSPYYSNYRKYKINSNEINKLGDVEYLNFGLSKYLENEDIKRINLIIVDGGKQHINEAKRILDKLNLNIPIIGLVKDNEHKTKYLMLHDETKVNINSSQIYNFLANIQIEVDKFAKNFHNKVKINSSLEGFLSTIDGIGPKTEEKLLNKFKTYSNIYNASYEELSSVVSPKISKKIIEKLKKNKVK